MIAGELSEGFDGGLFFYSDFGIFIQPKTFDIVYFSGKHSHGGTAAFAPEGVDPTPSDFRFNVVLYPNEATVRNLGPTPLGPLSVRQDLKITPEIHHCLP